MNLLKAGVSVFMLLFILNLAYIDTGDWTVFLSMILWPITTE